MCTAIALKTGDFYFGRTLDAERSYDQEVTFMPRRFPLVFREKGLLEPHYAIVGMAHVAEDVPLYFDAINEAGLAMAALNFEGYAHYGPRVAGKDNVASFELISWILAQCGSVGQAKNKLERLNITDQPFSEALPVSSLHWIIADRKEAVVLEAVEDGLRIYPNPVGVLTNNPGFDQQMFQLNNYMHLSSEQPKNRFSSNLDLNCYSRGMGAMGLPGDLSSQSRFVRAAFVKSNSVCGPSEEKRVSQFFHILDTVSQTRGCCKVGERDYEITVYSSCCNADKGIYYYTTYENRTIRAVAMDRENLDGTQLVRRRPVDREVIRMEN